MSEETLVTAEAEQDKTKVGESGTETETQPTTLLSADSEGEPAQEEGGTEQEPPETEKAEPESKPEGAPEKYEFKAPEEGAEFATEVLEAYEGVARELDLTQANAQRVLDVMAPKMREAQERQMDQLRKEWAAETKADKEIGGDKLDETLSLARRVIKAVNVEGLGDLLDTTGLGNRRELVAAFAKLGQWIGGDRLAGQPSPGAPAKETDAAKIMFPDMN